MENGDIFFAKKVRTRPSSRKLKQNYTEYELKGHAIGLCIGYVPPDKTGPTSKEAVRLLASTGYIGTDDIIECLGLEAYYKIEKYIVERYPA